MHVYYCWILSAPKCPLVYFQFSKNWTCIVECDVWYKWHVLLYDNIFSSLSGKIRLLKAVFGKNEAMFKCCILLWHFAFLFLYNRKFSFSLWGMSKHTLLPCMQDFDYTIDGHDTGLFIYLFNNGTLLLVWRIWYA